jgi:chromate reductase
MMSRPLIHTVCGSLRASSVHGALLDVAERYAHDAGADVHRETSLRSLPLYDPDIDRDTDEELSPGAAVRRRVASSDAVLLACPAYNGSVTGAMKNWVDWISRPFGPSVLQGRPLAIVTASPGSKGGVQAATYLERITRSLGAQLVAPPLTIANVATVLHADGRLDEPTRSAIHELVDALLAPPPAT